MALRDQPYLPLYIQDIMTDEKLNECCAATHGVYIKGIMCLMHKSEEYGKILLKQKDQQTGNKVKNFALKIAKHTPYSEEEIEAALFELLAEKVLYIDGDSLCQKRMINDNAISQARSAAGKTSAEIKKTKSSKRKKFVSTKPITNSPTNTQTKSSTNSENEIEDDNEDDIKNKKEPKKKIEIVFPFQSAEFSSTWNKWLEYRKEINKPYRSALSEKAALAKLGIHPESVAIEMIENSIANGWQGIFELKNNGKNVRSANQRTTESVSAGQEGFGSFG